MGLFHPRTAACFAPSGVSTYAIVILAQGSFYSGARGVLMVLDDMAERGDLVSNAELTRDSSSRLMFPKTVEQGDLDHGKTTVFGRGDYSQAA